MALFKDISVPHRLTLLVEGESLFNDAAAIALFSVLMAMLTTGTGAWNDGVMAFLRGFSGGMLVGFVLAVLASHLLAHLPGKRTAEVTVTVTVAYLAFVIGELAFHVSGVVAVVSAGLVFAYDGRTRVSPETWSFLTTDLEAIGILGEFADFPAGRLAHSGSAVGGRDFRHPDAGRALAQLPWLRARSFCSG